MGISTQTTLTPLLKQNNTTPNGPIDLLFREVDFLNVLRESGRVEDSQGAEPLTWNVTTAGNGSAEVFAEGAAPPVAGNETQTTASLSTFAVRTVYGLTRGAQINNEKRGYLGNAQEIESLGAEKALFKKIEDELMGSTADRGIASIIDATGTYAGLSQGTYSIWASNETNVGGALTLAVLQTLVEDMTNGTVGGIARGATPTHFLMPQNQISNYLALFGPSAGASSLVRMMPGHTDAGSGLGKGRYDYDAGAITIARCRSMTTTEIYLVDIMDMMLIQHGPLEEKEIVGNPQNIQFEVSSRHFFQVKSRNKHGKLTGVTA